MQNKPDLQAIEHENNKKSIFFIGKMFFEVLEVKSRFIQTSQALPHDDKKSYII